MEKKDLEMINLLADFLDESGINSQITEIGDRYVLDVEISDENGFAPESCLISVEHPNEESTCVQLWMILFSDMKESTTDDIAALMTTLNSKIIVGHFGLVKDEGCMYCAYSFLTDSLDEMSVLTSFAAGIDLIAGSAAACRKALIPLVNGEVTLGQISESELFT